MSYLIFILIQNIYLNSGIVYAEISERVKVSVQMYMKLYNKEKIMFGFVSVILFYEGALKYFCCFFRPFYFKAYSRTHRKAFLNQRYFIR